MRIYKIVSGIRIGLVVLLFACKSNTEEPTKIDRVFHLMGYMTGYVGVGGEIDGIRNPVLRVLEGERVRITMINGENMAHDVVIEGTDDRSSTINDRSEEHTSELQSRGHLVCR